MIHYDAQAGYMVLFRWKGTVLQMVAHSWVFWVLQMFHVATILRYHFGHEDMFVLEWSSVQPPLSLATFFLVFYGGTCYSRFYQLYGYTVGLSGGMQEWVSDVILHFPDDPTLQWNLCRLMLAGYQIMLCELDETKRVAPTQWQAMRSNNLLTASEIETVKAYGGFQPFVPIVWALQEVHQRSLDGSATDVVFSRFRTQAYAFRANMHAITSQLDMPVPFAYFHILKLLLIICMCVLSYALIELLEGEYFYTLLIFSIISCVMVGLEEIAVAMSDPFGDDSADFDTDAMAKSAYDATVAGLRLRPLQRLDTLGDDIGNPVTGVPPKATTPLAADWAAYGLTDDARTHNHNNEGIFDMFGACYSPSTASTDAEKKVKEAKTTEAPQKAEVQVKVAATVSPPTVLPPTVPPPTVSMASTSMQPTSTAAGVRYMKLEEEGVDA